MQYLACCGTLPLLLSRLFSTLGDGRNTYVLPGRRYICPYMYQDDCRDTVLQSIKLETKSTQGSIINMAMSFWESKPGYLFILLVAPQLCYTV